MPRLVKVAKADDIPPGTMKDVSVEGQELLVTNVGGRFYVVGNRCPHRNAKLSMGKLDGQIVTCPNHGSRFDVSDGSVVEWTPNLPSLVSKVGKVFRQPRPVKVYETKVEDGGVFISLA